MAKRSKRTKRPKNLTDAQEIEFATVRSHKASEIAYDLCKGISQTCLVINGGAATAILAYLVKDGVSPALYHNVALSLLFYGVGAFSSALMMFFIMQTADWWNYFWYASLYPEDDDDTDYETAAGWWHRFFYVAFIAAMGSFLFASGYLAYSLLNFTKV